MNTTPISYIVNVVLIAVIIILMYCNMNGGYGHGSMYENVHYSEQMQQAFKEKKVFSALAFTENLDIILTDINGKPANKKCVFNEKLVTKGLPLCTGSDKKLKEAHYNIIFTKGSFCASSSSGNNIYEQLCWTPNF